jgi:hypothetical protein
MSKSRSAPLSLRAFARLVGVDEAAIRKGVRTGRLRRSLGRDAKGRPHIANVGLARQEWVQNAARPDRARRPGGPLASLAEAQRLQAVERTRSLKLANDKKAGKLLDAEEVEIRWSAIVVEVRTHLLGLPARVKARLPHLTNADLAVLDKLVRECLEALADGRSGTEAAS